MQDHHINKLFQPDGRTNEGSWDGCYHKRPNKLGNKVIAPIIIHKRDTRDNQIKYQSVLTVTLRGIPNQAITTRYPEATLKPMLEYNTAMAVTTKVSRKGGKIYPPLTGGKRTTSSSRFRI